jgi:predicted SAM-dependent methyltransferase
MTSSKYLNLGCGSHFHEDWVNVDFTITGKDVIAHNLIYGIPFQNNTFDVVYHSHILEHFSKEDAKFFIRECYRVLKNDGILRVVIPDLEQIIFEYQKQFQLAIRGDENAIPNYDWIMIELFDQMVRNHSGGYMAEYFSKEKFENKDYVFKRIGHEARNIKLFDAKNDNHDLVKNRIPLKTKVKTSIKRFILKFLYKDDPEKTESYFKIGKFRSSGEIHQWMYDRYSLSLLLKQNGFKNIAIKTAYESDIPEFSTFNLDVVNGEIRKPDSLFVEAFK